MATTLAVDKPRSRQYQQKELTRSDFTCAPTQTGKTTCARVLWEDDRYGRVTEVMELPAQKAHVRVEIPAGRSAAGQVSWTPLEQVAGADSDAVRRLLAIIKELAGDVYAATTPLRTVEPFEVDESVHYGGVA